MPLQGKLIADFADFFKATQRAQQELDEMAGAAKRSGAALDDMVTTGQTSFDGLASAAQTTVGELNAMPLGGIRGALNQVAEAAGLTFQNLGLVGTAGAAIGAGLAGWNIGRAIANFFGLDEAIGNATAKLLGFGDIAAEVAGANADVLARASAQVGYEITNLAEALAITSVRIGDFRSNAAQSADAVKRWQADLDKIRTSGDLPQLTDDLASHNFTLKDLAARYHTTVEALQFFTRAQGEAAAATKAAAQVEAEVVKASNTTKLHALQEEITARNQAQKLEAQALLASTKLFDEFNTLRVEHGGTANEIAIAQIHRWADDLTAQMVKAGTATTGFYSALAADSKEKLSAVGVDWQYLRTHSIEGLQEMAANALRTYNEMIGGSQHFTREALDAQIAKVHDAENAARGMGKAYTDSFEKAAAAAKKLAAETEKASEAAKKANREMGNSVEYDLSTSQSRAQLAQDDPILFGFLHEGYSLAQATKAKLGLLYGFDPKIAEPGPRVPGFAGGVKNFGGGMAMVGERGPEVVRLPRGSDVIPFGYGAGGGSAGGVTISLNMNVSGIMDLRTQQELTRAVSEGVMESIRNLGTRF